MTENNRERLRKNEAAKAQQQRLNRIIGVGAAVLAVVLIAVFAVVLIQQQGTATPSSGSVTPPNATADGKAIVSNPGKAKAGAPVVELFFDYQCPVCKQFETLYGDALQALADSGEIELHNRTMTFLDTNLGNDSSLRAGIAAGCADVSGTYAAYHAEVYVHQPETEGAGYTDEVLRQTIPASVGITGDALTQFQACYDQQSTKAFVQGTNDKATQDGVNGTPTFHVNGHDVPLSSFSGVDPSELGALITQNA
ncbi:MAG: thioredoxin domain-containing protein [Propionicimonas sp.]